MMAEISAKQPELDGKMYHLRISKGELPPYVLLPGDPGRVDRICEFMDSFDILSQNREYRIARCSKDGVGIGVCSTGIGSPSTAIAIEELARAGCHTFIRVGSTGALRSDMSCGDIIINSSSVRCEGTSKEYVMPEYPASASMEVTLALIQACERMSCRYHVGIGASTDSFYAGQSRPGYGGYSPSYKSNFIDDLRSANVINFEMESSALFTLCNLYGLRAGCISAVFANREADKFLEVGENIAIESSINAVNILHDWDELKIKHSKKIFFPDLLKM